MKFLNSKLEERYNDLWNGNAVPADTRLRSMLMGQGFFAVDVLTVSKLLNQYAFTSKNIIHNLIRQSYLFEDKDYINGYLNETLINTAQDFAEYKAALVRHFGVDSDPVKLIEGTISELSGAINEYSKSIQETQSLQDDYPVNSY